MWKICAWGYVHLLELRKPNRIIWKIKDEDCELCIHAPRGFELSDLWVAKILKETAKPLWSTQGQCCLLHLTCRYVAAGAKISIFALDEEYKFFSTFCVISSAQCLAAAFPSKTWPSWTCLRATDPAFLSSKQPEACLDPVPFLAIILKYQLASIHFTPGISETASLALDHEAKFGKRRRIDLVSRP